MLARFGIYFWSFGAFKKLQKCHQNSMRKLASKRVGSEDVQLRKRFSSWWPWVPSFRAGKPPPTPSDFAPPQLFQVVTSFCFHLHFYCNLLEHPVLRLFLAVSFFSNCKIILRFWFPSGHHFWIIYAVFSVSSSSIDFALILINFETLLHGHRYVFYSKTR